jgi:hypothetical protein
MITMNAAVVMQKGGGFTRGWRVVIGAPPRHHHWTGTNDLPRPLVPPPDGGLHKPSNPWKRFVRWLTYYVRWLRYYVRLEEKDHGA